MAIGLGPTYRAATAPFRKLCALGLAGGGWGWTQHTVPPLGRSESYAHSVWLGGPASPHPPVILNVRASTGRMDDIGFIPLKNNIVFSKRDGHQTDIVLMRFRALGINLVREVCGVVSSTDLFSWGKPRSRRGVVTESSRSRRGVIYFLIGRMAESSRSRHGVVTW